MLSKFLLCSLALCLCVPAGIGAQSPNLAAPTLTAEQVVNKNVEARGGLKSWREVQAMTMTGKMDAGGKQNTQLPFAMKLKRPRMSRLELQFQGKTAVQVYDGQNGWKVRPFLGRNEVEPYTETEMQTAADQQELDGPLIDPAAKGINVEMVGVEAVEGRNAYKLKLTMKSGSVRHLWVDAQSFLEVKMEGTPRRARRTTQKVETYYRNYKQFGGLMMPTVLETVVEKVKPSRKINIEAIVLNPNLEDRTFAKPDIFGAPLQRSAQVR